jgi:hypothetical protein
MIFVIIYNVIYIIKRVIFTYVVKTKVNLSKFVDYGL